MVRLRRTDRQFGETRDPAVLHSGLLNPLYEEVVVSKNPITGREQKDVASPQRPESVAAFAKWAAAAARHFSGRRIIWEIWNEPNITFWKPKPDVLQYATLALAACKAIREADGRATIVAPATSEVSVKFLEEFFATGALAFLDAVSVHPYRSYKKPPETVIEDYAKLRALVERYAKTPEKKKLPILSGEWGYASHTKGVSLDTQAAYLVRQQLVNVLAGVPISIWYDWKNDGPDAAEREHNFGTVTHDLQPKPAYIALQTFTRELNGFRIERRLESNTNDFVLLLRNDSGQRKLATWTTMDAYHATLKVLGAGPSAVQVVNWRGEPSNVKVQRGELRLELAGQPSYCRLGELNVSPAIQTDQPGR